MEFEAAAVLSPKTLLASICDFSRTLGSLPVVVTDHHARSVFLGRTSLLSHLHVLVFEKISIRTDPRETS
jgi:hypothetical protein